MCVIMVASKKRPTEDMVGKAFHTNSDGGGVAWREDGLVHWEKGLNLEEMLTRCAELPLPFIAHFRISTCGGKVPTLCHPFPINNTAALDLKGTTDGYVLFHNGHWSDWKKYVLKAAINSNHKLTMREDWSDTRAMALIANHAGIGALQFVGEKAVVFGPEDIELFEGGQFSEEEGVWCSNLSWKNRHTNWRGVVDDEVDPYANYYHGVGTSYRGSLCTEGRCTNPRVKEFLHCRDHFSPEELIRWNAAIARLAAEKNGNNGSSDDKTKATIGGSPALQLTFPRSEDTVRSGEVVEESVEESTTHGADKGTEGKASPQGTVIHMENYTSWLRPFNPKKFKSNTPIGVDPRAQRIIEQKNGVVRLGPM